jgi:hypothetical protein
LMLYGQNILYFLKKYKILRAHILLLDAVYSNNMNPTRCFLIYQYFENSSLEKLLDKYPSNK